MAKIVYGVSGEGTGHASRARVMVPHLQSQGHEVRVVSYGRGYQDLKGEFRVFETEGLSIAAVDNTVSVGKTIADNLSRLVEGHKKARALKRELFEGFEPDCVITDFEPMTAYLAHHFDRPLITVDNQHRMRYMEHSVPKRLRGNEQMTLAVIRAMVPRPDVSLVTTFLIGRVTNERTFLFPPILRKEVLDRPPTPGEHVLVYLTRGFDTFVNRLRDYRRETFYVYGTGRNGSDGNLIFKASSREGFLEDLAGCSAVMATAGFTLITEALHLRKPYLALPMKGQFEQELNGLLLGDMGVGKNCWRVTPESVGDFLYHLPEYRERLKEYPSSGNQAIKAKLDELMADDCALAREFYRARSR